MSNLCFKRQNLRCFFPRTKRRFHEARFASSYDGGDLGIVPPPPWDGAPPAHPMHLQCLLVKLDAVVHGLLEAQGTHRP